MFYVYMLIDPRNNLPFYVGKGKNERMYFHENNYKSKKFHNRHLSNKIRSIKSKGYQIIYEQFYCDSEELALNLEYDLVKKYGRFHYDERGILVNICEGGGATPALCGEENGFFGKTHSDETRKIMSEKRSERKNTQLQKDTTSRLSKERWQDPEYREIMQEVKKNYIYTDEHKRKISESNMGKKISEETKQKLSISKTGIKPNLSDEQREARGERFKTTITSLLIEGKGLPWQDKVNKNPEKIEKTASRHRGMKRSKESKRNMSKGQKESYLARKENNTWFPTNFSGYYITPKGRFVSAIDAASEHKCNAASIRLRCRTQNVILMTPNKLKNSTDLTTPDKQYMIGKTWNSVGWGFEPC